ncbi:unnamed protein product [Sphenostylis stenocarpa]|uniref:Uncharacterized protein n=1 Tax=Sphenostylis stenocarpa TaxID=92480 RepID=A0AA86S2P0_9FABA|nr:unnamed protein product [Sphenostylis stenocarpa]
MHKTVLSMRSRSCSGHRKRKRQEEGMITCDKTGVNYMDNFDIEPLIFFVVYLQPSKLRLRRSSDGFVLVQLSPVTATRRAFRGFACGVGHVGNDFDNVSEVVHCVTWRDWEGQGERDTCRVVVSRRYTRHADKGVVSWILCMTGGGGQNGYSWRLQQGCEGVPP